METTLKFDTAKMKADIKAKAEQQRFFKNQRKTVKIVDERKMSASEAWYKHKTNRFELELLYAAYGIARGKTFNQIENNYPEESHPLKRCQKLIDKILEGYMMEVEVL